MTNSHIQVPQYAQLLEDDEEDSVTGVVNLIYKKAEDAAKEREAASERLKEKMRRLRERCQ